MPSLPRLCSFAVILVAAGGVVACGDTAPQTAGGTPGLDARGTTAEAATTAATEETRLVEHALGETEVPPDPQRVVVLDSPHLDAALSLGATPVGSVQSDVAGGLPEYLGDLTEGIEVVGTIEEPNLEAVAALHPDLILSASVRSAETYDELSQIAPTVLTDYEDGWQSGFMLVAEALGRTSEAETALADYTERAEALGEDVGADGAVASIVRFLPGETRIYGPGTFSGGVLADIGFDLTEMEYDEYGMAYISPEQIGLADADVLFHTAYGDPAATTEGSTTALWGTLSAVQEGCVFGVDDAEWMLGIGLKGAEVLLDDVEENLSAADCT